MRIVIVFAAAALLGYLAFDAYCVLHPLRCHDRIPLVLP
jgi:hypothetical protein